MKRFAAIIISAFAVVGVWGAAQPVSAAALPAPAGITASSKSDACAGIGLTGAHCGDQGKRLNKVLSNVVQILIVAVGLTAVIMIIVSGLKYITSAGDANGIASAKKTLIYALVGVVVAGIAQLLVHFVLSKT